MPILEFECPKGHTKEVLKKSTTKIGAVGVEFCDVCGMEMTMIMSAPGVFIGTPTPKYSGPIKTEDPGFQKEWDSIWNPKEDAK